MHLLHRSFQPVYIVKCFILALFLAICVTSNRLITSKPQFFSPVKKEGGGNNTYTLDYCEEHMKYLTYKHIRKDIIEINFNHSRLGHYDYEMVNEIRTYYLWQCCKKVLPPATPLHLQEHRKRSKCSGTSRQGTEIA